MFALQKFRVLSEPTSVTTTFFHQKDNQGLLISTIHKIAVVLLSPALLLWDCTKILETRRIRVHNAQAHQARADLKKRMTQVAYVAVPIAIVSLAGFAFWKYSSTKLPLSPASATTIPISKPITPVSLFQRILSSLQTVPGVAALPNCSWKDTVHWLSSAYSETSSLAHESWKSLTSGVSSSVSGTIPLVHRVWGSVTPWASSATARVSSTFSGTIPLAHRVWESVTPWASSASSGAASLVRWTWESLASLQPTIISLQPSAGSSQPLTTLLPLLDNCSQPSFQQLSFQQLTDRPLCSLNATDSGNL